MALDTFKLPWVAQSPTGREGSPDVGPVGLGQSAVSAPTAPPPKSSAPEMLAADSPLPSL